MQTGGPEPMHQVIRCVLRLDSLSHRACACTCACTCTCMCMYVHVHAHTCACVLDVCTAPGDAGDQDDEWLYLALLEQLVNKVFYTALRTKQQLGYIVRSAVDEAEGVCGLSFTVQSTKLSPPDLETRIEAFLQTYRDTTLARMAQSEFESYRDAVVTKSLDVDQRLDAQSSRLWEECARRRYDFGGPWRNAERLRQVITRQGLLAFYDRHIAVGGEQRRRLSTHVFASKIAPSTLRLDRLEDTFWLTEADGLATSVASTTALPLGPGRPKV